MGILDFLDSLPKRGDVTPEELAARRQGYADLYQGGFLARNRDQPPLSVRTVAATQDFVPGLGDVYALGEAYDAATRGELVSAGLLGTAAAVGLVPGAGDLISRPIAAAGRAGMRGLDVVADRLNQRGPMPTVYSNPLVPNINPTRREVSAELDNLVDARTSVEEMRRQANIDRFGYDPNEVPDAPPSAGLLSDYVGEHRAPMRDGNAPAFDLAGDIYPDDIYSSKAVQYYGTGDSAMDSETMGLLQSLRGQPDAAVTIYRAVPRGVDDLNAGDWVTVNRQYAQDHGEAALGGDFDIVEREVKASEIFTNGDSIHEFGYDPLPPAPSLPAPRNEAEAMAKQVLEMRAAGNADDVTEEMMAAADDTYMYFNTPLPMDEASRMARAQEMGFTTGRDRQDVMRELRGLDNPQLVHYTNQDFSEFRIPERQNRQAIWATPDPSANLATKDNFQDFSDEGVVGIPVMGRMTQRVSPYEFRMAGDPMTPGFPRNVTAEDVAKANSVGADYAEAGLEYAIFDPRNIRSRFARFDPAFAHLRNLSAGFGGLGLLGLAANNQPAQGDGT